MESNISIRISELIKVLGIKKAQFAEAISVDPAYVTQLTKGKRNPSTRLVESICREFHVNEEWLRTGKGEMFVKRASDNEIADAVNRLLSSESDSFRSRLILALCRLDDSKWSAIEDFAMELLDSHQEPVDPPPETDAERADRLERKVQELQTALDASLKEEQQTMAPAYVKT